MTSYLNCFIGIYTAEPPSPSVGDIRVDSSAMDNIISEVHVYLPDSAGPQWGGICMEDIGNAKAVGTVLCRQLGYTSGNVTSKPM